MAETHKERVDRELGEFLQELRVALPGVQVLFAFLLIVAFSERFRMLDAGERRVYFAATLAAATAVALLIAPTAHHRLRFRAGNKEQILHVGTALSLLGLTSLAISTVLTLHVLTRLLYDARVAAWVAAAATITIAGLWFVAPMFYGKGEYTEPPSDG